MLEVVNDMLCLTVGERCMVWVCRELSLTSDDMSVLALEG